ncbi:MAG: hypothetical protein IPM16_09660 [Chloroflexi bacterium]|nr:hypothetical protein [Chloroflexota bacterium]
MHLFAEVFPIEPAVVESIGAYTLRLSEERDRDRTGRLLARRLREALASPWLWSGGQLVTAVARSDVELMIALDILRGAEPDRLGHVQAVEAADAPSARQLAEFYVLTLSPALRGALESVLKRGGATIPAENGTIVIDREIRLQPWSVGDEPALSISVSSRIRHSRDAAALLGDGRDLTGMRVTGPGGFTAQVVAVDGTLRPAREKLLRQRIPDALGDLIRAAPGDSPVLRLKNERGSVRMPASGLSLALRLEDLAKFGVALEHAEPLVRLDPPTRAALIRSLSDVLKDENQIGRAYASRERADTFVMPTDDDIPYLRFADRRTRPAVPGRLAIDFLACGPYRLRDRFQTSPIRACIVNALSIKSDDFVEAMQRQLQRLIGFRLDIARERQVRVLKEDTLDAAVKLVEKETPDIVLLFLPDDAVAEYADYAKSLTLARALPAQIVTQTMIDDPDAMPGVIVQLLARTGNTPAALADPIDGFHEVVGLDRVRRTAGGVTTMHAVARVYAADGTFRRYVVRSSELSPQHPPYLLMRELFSQRDTSGKRIVVHVNGRLPADMRAAMKTWGQAIKAHFAIVEIVRRNVPRLYALDDRRVVAPPAGSQLVLSTSEAIVVLPYTPLPAPAQSPNLRGRGAMSGRIGDGNHIYLGMTPQPVHVLADGISLRQAVDSVIRWSLLDYSARPTGVPATVVNTDTLAFWLEKGGTFTQDGGDVPFWL